MAHCPWWQNVNAVEEEERGKNMLTMLLLSPLCRVLHNQSTSNIWSTCVPTQMCRHTSTSNIWYLYLFLFISLFYCYLSWWIKFIIICIKRKLKIFYPQVLKLNFNLKLNSTFGTRYQKKSRGTGKKLILHYFCCKHRAEDTRLPTSFNSNW